MDAVVVQFRAGRVDVTDGIARPNPKKGMIKLIQSGGGDGIIHFQYYVRGGTNSASQQQPSSSGEYLEEDLLLFPGDASWKRVNESSGRVYMLEIGSVTKIFWMQCKAGRDDEYAETINRFLGKRDVTGKEIDEMIVDLDHSRRQEQQQETVKENQQIVEAQRLASILASIASSQPQNVTHYNDTVTPSAGLGTILHQQRQQQSLMQIITPEIMTSVLQNESVVERLLPFLPESQRSLHHMNATVSSPQFRQQADAFSRLLSGGQVGWNQLGVRATSASHAPTSVEEFLSAIQAQHFTSSNDDAKHERGQNEHDSED